MGLTKPRRRGSEGLLTYLQGRQGGPRHHLGRPARLGHVAKATFGTSHVSKVAFATPARRPPHPLK
ncbi:hypothetical protein DMC64_22195 [Amycolatopsis sp. WAC 04197]|nr:hypothetical protein DMC64_22195 [Amycolatopsis sp. WAC 04197]